MIELFHRSKLRPLPWRKAVCFACLNESAVQAAMTGHRVVAEDFEVKGFAPRPNVLCHSEVTIGHACGAVAICLLAIGYGL